MNIVVDQGPSTLRFPPVVTHSSGHAGQAIPPLTPLKLVRYGRKIVRDSTSIQPRTSSPTRWSCLIQSTSIRNPSEPAPSPTPSLFQTFSPPSIVVIAVSRHILPSKRFLSCSSYGIDCSPMRSCIDTAIISYIGSIYIKDSSHKLPTQRNSRRGHRRQAYSPTMQQDTRRTQHVLRGHVTAYRDVEKRRT